MATKNVPEIFQHAKPICIAVTKNPTKDNLNIALSFFKTLEQKSLTDTTIFEYVVFPFKLVINRGNVLNEEQEILIFQCLKIIVEKAEKSAITEDFLLWGFNTFSVYFTTKDMLENRCDTKEPFKMKIEKSEEQKITLVEFMSILLQKINDKMVLNTYNVKNLPLVGHIVAVLINFAEKERNISQQVSAIQCLKLLVGSSLDYKKHHGVLGDYFACYFPGIALLFNNLLTSGENKSTKVITSLLDMFQFLVFIVLSDTNIKNETSEARKHDLFNFIERNCDSLIEAEEAQSHEDKKIKVVRNKQWLKKTTKHMETIFNNVLPILMTHKNANARKALLEFLNVVLTHCMKTLVNSVPCFLDAMAKLTSDTYEEIRRRSEVVLESARIRFQANGTQDLYIILQERLQSQILSLPRIMNGSNDDLKLAHLHIISGNLKFFGKHFQEYLYSLSNLETFFSALLQVLELQTKNISIVEERRNISLHAITIDSSTSKQQYQRDFRYFSSSEVLMAIKNIISLIVEYGDLDLVIDHLLTTTLNLRLRLQSVFVLNEVIICCKDKKDIDVTSYVDQIIETYLQECFWNLPVTNDHLQYFDSQYAQHLSLVQKSSYQVIPFEILNSNVQLICMLLEGLATHSFVLRTSYNVYLMRTLYPILEKIGSVNATISRSATQALLDISESTNYESVGDLLLINSDYLINAVTLQFRHFVYGTAAPCVLAVILKLCNSNIMPIICDAIDDVFQALDEYQEEVAEEMLNVLKYFAMAVDKWYNIKIQTQSTLKKESEITDTNNESISLTCFIHEYLKLSARASGNVDENDDTHEEMKDSMEEKSQNEQDENKEIPLHYQIVITSLKKCEYFVAAREKNVRLKSLDLVYHAIIALRQRENDLLPALHKIWPTIIQRLKETDLVIVLKALDVVCCMVSCSGDFLRKRLSTEFLPFSINFLKSRQNTFTKNKSQFTQEHKVIVKLISFLSDVVAHLDLSTKLFCEVSTVCLPYLSSNLHDSVQKAAVQAFVAFHQVQPDVIWLLLSTTSSSNELVRPHQAFSNVILPSSATKRNIYSENISEVFTKIK